MTKSKTVEIGGIRDLLPSGAWLLADTLVLVKANRWAVAGLVAGVVGALVALFSVVVHRRPARVASAVLLWIDRDASGSSASHR